MSNIAELVISTFEVHFSRHRRFDSETESPKGIICPAVHISSKKNSKYFIIVFVLPAVLVKPGCEQRGSSAPTWGDLDPLLF